MTDELNEKDRAALAFIRKFEAENGYPPSIRDVGRGIGEANPANAQRVLRRLVDGGHLRRPAGRVARGFRLADPGKGLRLPVRGRASCGPRRAADDDPGEELDLAAMFGRADLVAYRANGTSMREDAIKHRDWLIVREQPDPDDGQTAVVMLDRDLVCKKIYREGDRIRLEPCNGDMAPIYADPRGTHCRVLGVLHAVIRKV